MNNRITTHDILTGDFLDCNAYAFINTHWEIKTPKIPNLNFFEKLKSDIRQESPKYFRLAKFRCRRYKTQQLVTSISYEGINWIYQATIYFKEDNNFYWVKNVERINDGRLVISLEIDWIAADWSLVGELKGLYVFDIKPLTLEQIKNIENSCFLCPNNASDDNYVIPSWTSFSEAFIGAAANTTKKAKTIKKAGKYTIWRLLDASSRQTRHTNGKFDRPLVTDHIMERTNESNIGLAELAIFVMPQDNGVDSKIPCQETAFIPEEYLTENFNTNHYLSNHGRYLVKILGEEAGEVKGINVNKSLSYYNDILTVNINEGYYDWELQIILNNNVFIKHFFIKEIKEKGEKTNWLNVIGSTIIAAVSIGIAVGSGGVTTVGALGATARAGKVWANALNPVKHSACVDEVTSFFYLKSDYDLFEIIPQIPWQHYQDYIGKINWHIFNDYFPLHNDETVQLIPNIGSFGASGINLFGDLNGWVKLSDKCAINSANRVIDFLRKNKVFIYSENPPEKKYLNLGSYSYEPFNWSPTEKSVDCSWTTTHTNTNRQLINREETFVWTYANINGRREQWRNGNTHSITIGAGDTFGTAYQRWNPNEVTNYNVQAGDNIVFKPTATGGQVVEQWRTTTQTVTQNHSIPTQKFKPSSITITPQMRQGINPLNNWGGKPPSSNFGSGGNPPPMPNLTVKAPIYQPTEQVSGFLQPKQLRREGITAPVHSNIPTIKKDPLNTSDLRERQQERIRLQQQEAQRQQLKPKIREGFTTQTQQTPAEQTFIPDIPEETIETTKERKKITE